ncbi:MAG: gnd 2 [Ferruginibacter sp.]|nr:gnd 2 [Ferruginibacter sp.]
MSETQYNFGMIGLGTMGCNLVLNMSDKNFTVAGYDKDPAKVDALNNLAGSRPLKAFSDISTFTNSLSTPRVIMLLVPAGPIVDAVIKELRPLLTAEDVIIDCGNSHFIDTQLRIDNLSKEGLHFMGIGVSGGETGARFGPSIMPGGDKAAYQRIAPMLDAISAKVEGVPCTAYMGTGAAGHYVKMVHNGIEYALMQLISEAYHLLKHAGRSNKELHDIFTRWNKGVLRSFLMEITAAIFEQPDESGAEMLIDKIKDTAHQKGTGAWMSQDAMKIPAPIAAIDAAVSQRILSSLKEERVAAAGSISGATAKDMPARFEESALENALHAAFIITYAQGLAMLQKASDSYKYGVNIATVSTIWRGGCIIRAGLLEGITEVFDKDPGLTNLMLDPAQKNTLESLLPAMRSIVQSGIGAAIPLPSFSSCIHYYDSYHSAWLPANLVQAQRDFFGAHTYERTDKPGTFHTNWNETIQ